MVEVLGEYSPDTAIILGGDFNTGTHSAQRKAWIREEVAIILNDISEPTHGNRCLGLMALIPIGEAPDCLLNQEYLGRTHTVGK